MRAIKIDGGASFTRKEIDAFGEYVKTYRAKGLAFLREAVKAAQKPVQHQQPPRKKKKSKER